MQKGWPTPPLFLFFLAQPTPACPKPRKSRAFLCAPQRTPRLGVIFFLSSLATRHVSLATSSFPVRHPNILHLIGMLQIPTTLTLLCCEEVDLAALIGPHLLQIPHR